MWKVIIFVAVMLYLAYLAMTLGQAFGIIQYTNRKITTGRMLVPFYYWFAPSDERKKKSKQN